MAEKRAQRRLAAILAADVVGYSRLMEQDEADTLSALKARRQDVLAPVVAQHNGRVVKLMGDGVLVEFGSAVDAVQCAIELQKGFIEANQGVPEARQIALRMGINLGDVIVEGTDLYGDGVNVAARLEGLAEPGGIYISGSVYDQVKRKLSSSFDELGPHVVKNIAEPVQVYRVRTGDREAAQSTAQTQTKPSIAVLPFANMSGDAEQQYFSDGITEDIITELSRFRSLFVIARNSSFQYREKAMDMQRVGRELGVRYVVEGSVRKMADKVRITAQLIDAPSANHLWSERYDLELKDIFAVQDELVRAICGVIPGQLDRFAVEALRRKPPDNLTAYDCELRGRWAMAHWSEGLSVALEWFEKAAKADPNYAMAHAGMALVYAYEIVVLGLPPGTSRMAQAKEHAQRATVLDDRNPTVQAYAGMAYLLTCEYQLSRAHAERAVFLNPNDPFALFVKATVLTYAGDQEQALEYFAKSERLEPYAPDDERLDFLCDCHYLLGNFEKVIEIHELYQNLPASLYLVLAAACAQAGRPAQAKAAMADYERLRPAGHEALTMIKHQMRMCWRQEDRDRWFEGYRKAGLPV
jgi:adenylate cyclase